MRPILAIALLLSLAPPAVAASQDGPGPLTIATWGGSYEASQQAAYFQPFTQRTDIAIETAPYSGGVAAVRKAARSDTIGWDIVDMTMADHRRACRMGYLRKFNHRVLAPAPDGSAALNDVINGSYTSCGIGHNVFSMVVAYDARAFRGAQPYRIEHLFQPDEFPGGRALRKRPDALLEWALLSYGVPPADLYSLLSTERGMRLAFDQLDRIRDQIIWWTDPKQATQLLTSDRASFASGYNGRFFHARVVERKPVEILWDAQVYELEVWGIVKGAPHPEIAERFIRFATRPRSMERFASQIAYGPTRRSAMRRVGQHATTGVDMKIYMPTHESHMDRAIKKDVAWYASTRETLNERFDAWLDRGAP
jgi:putative spermidine/putrescine transport system substrate-binding protein